MSIYWVTVVKDGEQLEGCVAMPLVSGMTPEECAMSEKAYVETKLGCGVVTMKSLPYAARPLLLGHDITFCHSPRECAGRTACPKRRSCCD